MTRCGAQVALATKTGRVCVLAYRLHHDAGRRRWVGTEVKTTYEPVYFFTTPFISRFISFSLASAHISRPNRHFILAIRQRPRQTAPRVVA